MARTKKNKVDYFSHDCTHGKTLAIIEGEFGNDGYAFWFKLLEMLGDTDNHYLKYDDINVQKFLHVRSKTTPEQALKILDLCALLGAIDADLWAHKVIWSDNFISRIADVYRNRRVDTPAKPIINTNLHVEIPVISEPTSKSTQSKVKESKVNTLISIGNDRFTIPPSQIAQENFRIRLDATLSASLRDIDQKTLFEKFDQEYVSYEFTDTNHFFNALKSVGEKIRNPKKVFSARAEEPNIDDIKHA